MVSSGAFVNIGSNVCAFHFSFFFFQAEDGIRDLTVTGVQTCALPICRAIVADDEDDVALQSIALGGEFAEVNAARPVLRNFDPGTRFPLTIAHAFLAKDRKSVV